MEENKTTSLISLQEIIDLSQKYIAGEITQEDLQKYGESMSIRSYISIKEKRAIIDALLLMQEADYLNGEQNYISVNLHKNLFFYGILSGYGLIDCSNTELFTDENYDLLYPLFAPFILSYCGNDFTLLKDMLYQAINFGNIRALLSALEAVDEVALSKSTDQNKALIKEIESNAELIAQLNNIAIMNDPQTAEVIKAIKDMSENK